MNLASNDLLPGFPTVAIKQASFSLPLTPFFNDAASLGEIRSRGFHGKPFHRQFKSTGNQEDQPICGYEGFRTLGSTGVIRKWEYVLPDGIWEFERENWDITVTRSHFFNEAANQVEILETLIPEGVDTGPLLYWSHSRTPGTGIIGDPSTDQDTEEPPPGFGDSVANGTVTLSAPVDKPWLTSELNRWRAMPEAFTQATGSGLGTYSFIGQGATQSESDGWLASVGGGKCKAQGPWFSGTPFGMAGDAGEKWNGKFGTWVGLVTRKNAPCLYQESGVRSDGMVIEPQYNPLAVGRSIYRQGYSETELSEPVGHLWCDNFGVFGDTTILDQFPMSPAYTLDFASLLHYHGEGQANELTLLSRTGKRYRVTLQAGYAEYEYDENDWEAEPIETWVTMESFVLTTDESLMASASIGEVENAWDMRVARIEQEIIIEEQPQWKLIADIEAYQQYLEDLQAWQEAWDAWDAGGREGDAPVKPPVMRDPRQLIGPSITGNFLLLAAMKLRRGERFGFYPLVYSPDAPNDRYRKKTFKLHLTPGSVDPYGGGCGLENLSGNADFVWSEEYDIHAGLPMPRQVHQWSLTLNGVDWTQDSPLDFDFIAFPGSTWTEQSATRQRREGTHTWVGKVLVGFDAPDPHGRLVSADWVMAGMTASDGTNKTTDIDLDPPPSGHSRFFEGHRLTYSPET